MFINYFFLYSFSLILTTRPYVVLWVGVLIRLTMTVVSTVQYSPFLSSDKNAFNITYIIKKKKVWKINLSANVDCSLTEISSKALFKCWQHHSLLHLFFLNVRPLVLWFSRAHYTYLHAVWLNYDYLNGMQSSSYWSTGIHSTTMTEFYREYQNIAYLITP